MKKLDRTPTCDRCGSYKCDGDPCTKMIDLPAKKRIELHRVQFNLAERVWVATTDSEVIYRAPKSLTKYETIIRAAEKLDIEISDLHVVLYKDISRPSELAMHLSEVPRSPQTADDREPG